MSRPIEREFKLLLTGAAAEHALLASLGAAATPAVLQTNHFFDTAAHDLRRARIALRLREERGAFTLTLKGPLLAEARDALAARPEEELSVSPTDARTLLAGTRSPLELLERSALAAAPIVRKASEVTGTSALHPLGSFQNERRRVGPVTLPVRPSPPPLVLELDTTRFPNGVVEHELEVELPADADAPAVERALRTWLAAHDLAVVPARSKAERFFASVTDTNL